MKKKIQKLMTMIDKKPIPSIVIASLLITLITELFSKRSLIRLFSFLVKSPHIFLLNTLIILWSFSILLFVRRKWFFGILIGFLWIVLGAADCVLLSFRVTPFNFSDLRLTKDAFAIAGKYITPVTGILLAAAVFLGISFLVFCFLKLPKFHGHFSRVRGFLLSFVFLLAVIGVNSTLIEAGILEKNFANLAEAYQNYGFVYCFTNSAINTGVQKPSDYSEEAVEEIANEKTEPESRVPNYPVWEDHHEKVDTIGIKATKETPNIIFLQLESFSDPTLYNHCSVSEDPIPNFHNLFRKYSSGYVSVPSVGAGTANTEFEVMTGMDLDFFGPGEYPYKTVLQDEVCESLAFDLKEMGYHAHAIHDNSGTFYDRYTVFSRLGYDTFTSIEYMNDYETNVNGWAKDKVLTAQIADVLNSTSGADYIYTISVQGHGSYPTEKVIEDPEITVTGLDEEATNQMEYYISQIHEMDEFVKELTDYLSERDEPTILVMYGDHLPSLDLTADKLVIHNEFQMEYVIWDNIGLEKQEKDLEAYQLASYVQSRIGFSQGTLFRFHQKYMQQESHTEEEENTYLADLQLLEYDMLYGDQEIYGGESPFVESDLQFGVKDPEISTILRQGNTLYLLGWNFTAYSIAAIDGKEQETTFVTPNMILVKEVHEIEESVPVTVEQVSTDNIVLSRTEPYEFTP